MKAFRLFISFLISLSLTVIGFTSFFSSPVAAEPITLSILLSATELAEWKPIAQQFEVTHPQIRLNLVEGPNATNQVEDLYTYSFLLGDSPYDLVYMDIVWVPKLAAAGWLQDLSPYKNKVDLSAYLTKSVEGGVYQDKLYWMPFRSDAGILYYRPDLLKQAGYTPPRTFQALLTVSKALQEEGLVEWGYVWQGKQYEGLSAMFVEILAGYGAFWVNPDTLEVGLDQPKAIQAVEFLRRTLEQKISPPGVTAYGEEETRFLFQNGKVAFLRNWPYVFSLASTPDSKIKGKFAMIPMIHAPDASSAACQGGWGLGIAHRSKHPQEAWEFIQFMVSESVQRDFVLNTGKVPTLRSLFTDPVIVAQYPHYPELLTIVQQATLRPPIPQYAQVSDILQRYLSAALTDKMTPEAAMSAAARETRLLLRVTSQPQ